MNFSKNNKKLFSVCDMSFRFVKSDESALKTFYCACVVSMALQLTIKNFKSVIYHLTL